MIARRAESITQSRVIPLQRSVGFRGWQVPNTENTWAWLDGDVGSYSSTFGNLLLDYKGISLHQARSDGLTDLRYKMLSRLLHDMHVRDEKLPRVLDLMSEGAFHASAGVPGTVVGLQDRRNANIRISHDEAGVEFIGADINSMDLWRRLREGVNQNGSYNLIVSRPIGAITRIPASLPYYADILTRVYPLLSPRDGIFLSEFKPGMSGNIRPHVDRLDRVSGLRVTSDESFDTFMLVRGEGAPDPRTFRNIVMRGR